MSLSTELGLNGLHVEAGTPKLDEVLIVGRGDGFKSTFRLALQDRQNRFAEIDVVFDFLAGKLFALETRSPSTAELSCNQQACVCLWEPGLLVSCNVPLGDPHQIR
jgi:hypothetical protein